MAEPAASGGMVSEGPDRVALESSIGRLITTGTYVSVALIAIGVVLLILAGQSPLDAIAGFDPSAIGDDLAHARPEAFLWLGLVLVIATPSARVAAALLGYGRRGERAMALVAVLILGVIAIGIVSGLAGS
jgi:uncharacterized membrane protein